MQNADRYIFFSEHVLVAASQTPPALAQSAAVFAVFTSWAKAGPVKQVRGPVRKSRLEFSWRLLPYAGLKVLSLNRLRGLAFQERLLLSRVDSTRHGRSGEDGSVGFKPLTF